MVNIEPISENQKRLFNSYKEGKHLVAYGCAGTGGAASNNSLDMRAEMKAASLIQRHNHWDATILNPIQTYELAVRGSKDWVTWEIPLKKGVRQLLVFLKQKKEGFL